MNRFSLASFCRRETRDSESRNCDNNQLQMEALEPLNMLAPVYPDLFAWESESRGYLHDYHVEGNLLRFSTALANMGEGHLEVFGGQVLPNGNQEVFQRVYHDDGSFEDHLAGEFTYHSGHAHIHFDGYAIYNLREITSGGGVGDIVATGGKVSFCLIDIAQYSSSAGSSQYHSCGTTQGITAGWSDVYGSGLSDQWINITGIDDGTYWLEVVVDPEDQLLESDETNNTTLIEVDISGGPGDQGDRYEPNNNFAAAYNLGPVAKRLEAGVSVHNSTDSDFYQFSAVEDGDFDISVLFTHDLGNLDAYVYDAGQNLIASSSSTNDVETLQFPVLEGETFYLVVEGVGGESNGYELDFDGPGNIVTETVSSGNVPVDIPDGVGSSQPGAPAISTLQGPDLTLTDLNLIFDDLDHSWLGDLNFELTSPAGTKALVIASQWNNGGLLGSEDDFTSTFLDDQAPANLDDGGSPFTGSFNIEHSSVPANPLSVFNGESALGTWTIEIVDWHGADSGTLNAWSIMFSGIDNNPGDQMEQNDAFPQATWLGELGSSKLDSLSIHKTTDQDFYRFQAMATGVAHVDIAFQHSTGNLDFAVFDESLNEIGRADSTSDDESLSVNVETGGTYYVQVFGTGNATNDNYSLTVDTPTQVFDTGQITPLGTAWQTVTFDRQYVDPVVVLTLPTFNNRDAVTTRIQNVTSTGFEMQLMEWNYQDGNHDPEEIGFFVIESGAHVMADGSIIEAGVIDSVNDVATRFTYSSPFDSRPVVIAQVESSHADALVPRLEQSEPGSFALRVQEQESSDNGSAADVHFISIQKGTGEFDGRQFEAFNIEQTTGQSVRFDTKFHTTPLVFGTVQSEVETDTVNVRTRGVSTTGFGFNLQEEQSADSERTHAPETFGFLALTVTPVHQRKPGVEIDRLTPFEVVGEVAPFKPLKRFDQSVDPTSRSGIDVDAPSVVRMTDLAIQEFDVARLVNANRLAELSAESVKVFDDSAEVGVIADLETAETVQLETKKPETIMPTTLDAVFQQAR